MDKIFCDNLKNARKSAYLTQAQVAKELGVVESCYANWEQGRTEPSIDSLRKLSKILNVSIDDKGAFEMARRSRGTPRLANRFLKRVRDFAQVKANGVITHEVADMALKRLEVDELGLDSIDSRMICAMIENFGGGPVGLETIAATIGEEPNTIEDVYEPYLLQLGFISRTPRGRIATKLAYDHFGIAFAE